MQTLWDITRRVFYLSVFIIPIPIGAYTIHNGSSAMAALVAYVLLSLFMPFFYLSSEKSGFGPNQFRIRRFMYWLGWILVQIVTAISFQALTLDILWNLPSVGRDITFILVMYFQILIAMMSGYVFSTLIKKRK